MATKPQLDTIAGVAQLIAMMAIVAALYFGRDVFIPLVLAVLIAFLLSPVVKRIERLGVGNTMAVVVTAAVAFILAATTLTLVGREISNLVTELPKYQGELVSKARALAGISSGVGSELGNLATEVTKAIGNSTHEPAKESKSKEGREESDAADGDQEGSLNPLQRWVARTIGPTSQEQVHDGSSPNSPLYTIPVGGRFSPLAWAGTAGSVLGPLGTLGLVTVFVLFLLIHRDDMRDRMIKVISRGNYVTTTDALQEVSRRITKYLMAQTILNAGYGVALAMGLFVVGKALAPDGHFPNYVLWGVIAGLLRFVPYLGPVIAAIFPILISIAVFPGYSVTIAVVSLIIGMELFSNNVIEPWLYSTSSGISSIAVIVAAVFWGWLWGPVGLFLSTPLTVCLVVLGRYVPRFRVFATLLGESSNISPWQRYYQRLLASDNQKASEFLAEHIETDGGASTIDRILVPTFRRMRLDYEVHEQLTPEQTSELLSTVAQSIEEVEWAASAEDSNGSTADEGDGKSPASEAADRVPSLRINGCAAHHAAEEFLLTALKKMQPDLDLSIIDSTLLPDDVANAAVAGEPAAILIMVLPQGGFSQARFLAKSIRRLDYKGTVIVCCCGKFVHFDRLFVKFRKAGVNYMTTSIGQTALKLKSLAQSQPAAGATDRQRADAE